MIEFGLAKEKSTNQFRLKLVSINNLYEQLVNIFSNIQWKISDSIYSEDVGDVIIWSEYLRDNFLIYSPGKSTM